MAITVDRYRWIGLTGVLLIIVGHWLDFIFLVYLDPLARLFLLTFAFFYWKDHKDAFASILLAALFIVFLLSITTIAQLYTAPGLI